MILLGEKTAGYGLAEEGDYEDCCADEREAQNALLDQITAEMDIAVSRLSEEGIEVGIETAQPAPAFLSWLQNKGRKGGA